MRITTDCDRVAKWLAPRVGVPRFAGPYTVIGFLNEADELTGGCLFNNHNGANIELTLAGRSCVSRGAWAHIRAYVFDQLKCRRLTVVVKARNERVWRMAEKFGFAPEGTMRHYFPDDDGVLYALLREYA